MNQGPSRRACSAAIFACLVAAFADARAFTPAPAPPNALAAAAAAGEDQRTPYVVPNAEQRRLRASGSGREYQVFVAAPAGEAPPQGYAVIYVLDGNAMFLTAVEAVRAQERRPDCDASARALVVGIGYPPGADVGVERTWDLTPVPSRDPRVRAPGGGADAFLDFIESDLKPAIERDYPVDRGRQALFGHSFGGLFTLYALTARPGAFQTYVGASASFWYADGDLGRRIERFAEGRDAEDPPLRVLLTAGEYEQIPSPAMRRQPDAARIAADLRARAQGDRARTAAERLAAAPGLRAEFQLIAGEDHGSVIPAAIGRAVRYILAPPPPVPPVPTARAYWDMTPQQRYDLRLQVRELPDPQRIPWLQRLKDTLHDGLGEAQVEQLHEERNAMDREHGTRPHAVNAR